ncbi:ATP-binding protein [candidate division WOR-3 bacterium]|nr:ATP-binding protein [candidate division WOR-3 bacterium]
MPKKIYLIDTGISNIIKHPKMLDIGRTEENIVFLKLKEMYNDIHYWKDRYGKEVDFVITNEKGKKHLIQVCHNLENENTHNREKRALVSAAEFFKLNKGIIVNDSIEQKIKHKNIIITYIPFWKFLLMDSID